MMPELGKHALPVLGSYAVGLVLIAGLVALSVLRARRVRRDLERVETRMRRHG